MKWLIILCVLIYQCKSHNECNNPVVIPRSTSIDQAESAHSRSRRATQNIRIARHYDSSFSSLSNSDAITSQVLDPAIQFWQNSLLVNNPLTTPLVVDRDCTGSFTYVTSGQNKLKVCSTGCTSSQLCYTTQIPNTYLKQCYTRNGDGYASSGSTGAGAANADLLLIITHNSESCGSNVLAYALACELEQTLDRPVIGLINICPGRINLGVGLKMSIATVKHEIAHVLGLSSNLYAFYRNSTGAPLTPRDNKGVPSLGNKYIGSALIYQYSDTTVKDYSKTFNYATGPSTKTVSYMVTPTITREIRNHFNCQTLEGMMLEDYGTPGSALSHFDKLYLQSELMTASISVVPRTSRLTLAALQDTGWYVTNFANAEEFTYGKNLGCSFITSSCFDYMNIMQSSSLTIAPYCNTPVSTAGLSCTPDRKVQTYCNLVEDSNAAASVPAQFKYFSNPNLVSTDPFSDYCPFITAYALSLSVGLLQTGECADPQNSALQGSNYDYFNQGFGSNSICLNFPTPPSWYYESCRSRFTPSIQGSGCYQYQCLQNYGLVITVNKLQYQCRAANQIVDVTSKNTYLTPRGSVVCPDCASLCDASICNSVSSTMAVPCNNVDRLCPGVTSYTVPCSAVTMKFGLLHKLFVLVVFLLLRP